MKIFRFRRKSGAEERAFTLVEMMTTVSLLSMLILAGMSLMTSGSIFFRNSTKNAFAESDVTYAARFVEMKLADASQFTIPASDSGTKITFKNSDGIDCSFSLTGTDDIGFSGHRTLQYTGPDATGKTVLVGIPTATAVFSTTAVGLVTNQSQMGRITVTLLAERQSAASTGAVKLVKQKTVLRIVPRNLYDDINGNG